MSDIKKGVPHGNHTTGQAKPRALVHKKILDAARAHPKASIEDLAEEVCGASVDLVERVLDEYGDPAEMETGADPPTEKNVSKSDKGQKESTVIIDQSDNKNMDEDNQNDTTVSGGNNESNSTTLEETTDSSEPATASTDTDSGDIDAGYTHSTETGTMGPEGGKNSESTEDQASSSSDQTETITDTTNESPKTEDNVNGETKSPPSPDELSGKQLEVLQEVRHRPHATQAELANEFNVSRATISQRVNAIDGFEWSERQQFVNAVFDGSIPISDGNGDSESVDKILDRLDNLSDRLEVLERHSEKESHSSPFDDPELATAVVRACIDSDHVTEEQEEQIIIELIEK